MLAVTAMTMIAVAGCGSDSASAPDDAASAGIELPAESVQPTASDSALGASDPMADLEIEDQVGDGRSVVVQSVVTSRDFALLVITDLNGEVLGAKRVRPTVQPVTVPLTTPVTTSGELLGSLYLDSGNGNFDPAQDTPLVDDENEVVGEDFDYIVQ